MTRASWRWYIRTRHVWLQEDGIAVFTSTLCKCNNPHEKSKWTEVCIKKPRVTACTFIHLQKLSSEVTYIRLSRRIMCSAQGHNTLFQKNLKSSNLQPFGSQPRSLTTKPHQRINLFKFRLIQVQMPQLFWASWTVLSCHWFWESCNILML